MGFSKVKHVPALPQAANIERGMSAGKAGVVSNSFAYGVSTLPLTKDELAAAGR